MSIFDQVGAQPQGQLTPDFAPSTGGGSIFDQISVKPGYDKITGFAVSSLESFPELFGIHPTQKTQEYRAKYPVLGFASQVIGPMPAYVGAAKLLRALPATAGVINAAKAMGGESLIAQRALEWGTEVAMIEGGKLALSATPLPGALFSAIEGRPVERDESLGSMAWGSFGNVLGGAALGGVFGGLESKIAAGKKAWQIEPLMHYDNDPFTQMRGAKTFLLDVESGARTADPKDVAIVQRGYDALQSLHAQDLQPRYGSNGIVESAGKYWSDAGKVYKPLEGEKPLKNGEYGPRAKFLSTAATIKSDKDNLYYAARPITSPSSGFATVEDTAAAIERSGLTREEIALNTLNPRFIGVKEGVGKRPEPVSNVERATTEPAPGQMHESMGDDFAFELADEGAIQAEFEALQNSGIDPTLKAIADIRSHVDELGDAGAEALFQQERAALQNSNKRLLSGAEAWNKPASPDPLYAAAKKLENRFTKGPFKPIGDGKYMAREKDDGLFVVAWKTKGEVGTAAAGDEWFVGRTDRPDFFSPQSAKAHYEFSKTGYFPVRAPTPLIPEVGIWNAGSSLWTLLDKNQVLAKAKRKGALGSVLDDAGAEVANIIAPSGPLGATNPLLNKSLVWMQQMNNIVRGQVHDLIYGKRLPAGGASVMTDAMRLDPKSTKALDDMIGELDATDFAQIKEVLERGVPFKQILEVAKRATTDPGATLFSQKTIDVLKVLDGFATDYAHQLSKLGEVVSVDQAHVLLARFQSRQGHYLLTREYPGNFEIWLHAPSVDDPSMLGDVIGVASGVTPKKALETAEQLKNSLMKEKGLDVRLGGSFDKSKYDAQSLAQLRRAMQKPGFINSRSEMIGYELMRGDLNAKKLLELINKNLTWRLDFIKNVTAMEQLAEPLARLERTDPIKAQALTQRMRLYGILEGGEGAFARAQNQVMDKMLSAVGFAPSDSASKIARNIQTALAHYQFNFANLTAPIANLIGLTQTLLPEMSFVLHASDDVLSRNYASMVALDRNNQVIGNLGFLSEFKLLRNAMSRISTMKWADQPEDFQHVYLTMVKEGYIAPRFVEAQLGADGAMLMNVTKAYKEGNSFVSMMGVANSLMMGKTEELSRTLTVAAAYEIGKLRGLPPDRLAVFVREMISKVNFNYGVADRATIFTTPLGSLAGTFKNWMFHYTANTIKYATGGKETLPALFWQTAATALFGGTVATPLMPMLDGASKFLTDKGLLQNMYAKAGYDDDAKHWADGVMYGLPGIMGLSMTSTLAGVGSNPMRDAQMMYSFAGWDRMKALSEGTKDALSVWRATGQAPFQDERVRGELMRALAPRTIYRGLAVAQDNAIKSLTTGYDVKQDIGLGGALMYAAGFSTPDLENTYAVYNAVRNDQAKEKELVGRLGQAMADAWDANDDRAASLIYTRAMAVGVDTSSVLRSAQSRSRRSQETQLGYAASPEQEQQYQWLFNK